MSLLMRFLTAWEGVRLQAYQDQEGTWTIGIGHTGPEVHAGLVISMPQAMQLLREDISHAFQEVALFTPEISHMPNPQRIYTALTSWQFNVGALPDDSVLVPAALAKRSTLDLTHAMSLWDHIEINGIFVVDPGLQRRRAAEIDIIDTGQVCGTDGQLFGTIVN